MAHSSNCSPTIINLAFFDVEPRPACTNVRLQATHCISLVCFRLFELERGLKKLFLRMSPENSQTSVQVTKEEVGLDDARLGRHVIIVMQALGAAVASLDDSRYLTSVLQNLGEMHVNYKVTGEMLPVSNTTNTLASLKVLDYLSFSQQSKYWIIHSFYHS